MTKIFQGESGEIVAVSERNGRLDLEIESLRNKGELGTKSPSHLGSDTEGNEEQRVGATVLH